MERAPGVQAVCCACQVKEFGLCAEDEAAEAFMDLTEIRFY